MVNHVLFISKWYPNELDPQLGDFIKKQAQALSKFVKVTVIFPCQNDVDKIEVNQEGNFTEVISYYKPKRGLDPITRRLINWKRYRKAFDKGLKEIQFKPEKNTVVHAHILNRSAVLAKQIAKKFKLPWIISEQSSEYLPQHGGRSTLKVQIGKALASQANEMITPSAFLKRNLEKIGFRPNIKVVSNICLTNEKVSEYPAPNPFIFLMVADLHDEVKNISGLIKTFSKVNAQNENTELWIIGGGADEKKLKEQAAETICHAKIKFLGRMTQPKVQTYFKKVHCLVVNSWVETFSVVCTEALANGRPVISTKCGGPEEIIKKGYGWLFEPGDYDELKAYMLRMIEQHQNFNPDKIASEIRASFSPESTARALLNIYNQVLVEKN
jgi:glycosyltransferase involved in cell wall biosynthesis